jgi:hypothetical protein
MMFVVRMIREREGKQGNELAAVINSRLLLWNEKKARELLELVHLRRYVQYIQGGHLVPLERPSVRRA